ncbi:retrotransposon protein, putative, ty1-copia subclass, partial [Tanacetum coccineum]
KLTPPYTPQHNGVSERRNRTLLNMVRSMMNLTTLPLFFWDYALEYATRILNMVPTKKKKTDMDGIVHTYKARLVAKGYTQLYEVDYEETFSPVADIRAIRILISITTLYDYEIWQMDVKTAFLNGYLDEDIYMVQPEGFVDPNHPRKASGSNVTFLILYVDDIIIMGNHISSLKSVKDYLGKCFAMKDLGEVAFILGIKIYRDRSKRLIGLGQNAYMDKILKRYKMDNSKRGHIPMQERLELNKTQGASTPEEVKCMQNVPYASAVGSIMYAVRCTRPDVAFAQNITSRFQQNPSELHWTAVENILKYLRNTKDMFLVYGGNPKAKLSRFRGIAIVILDLRPI